MRDIRFDPGQDTLIAIGSLLAFWGIYYLQGTVSGPLMLAVFLGANLLLCVLLPAYYVVRIRGEALSAVGLTKRGWKRALSVSIVGATLLSPGLVLVSSELTTTALLAHTLTIGLLFWEPFFVHGWLQTRFEHGFGAGGGVLLAGAGFALFHVGRLSPTVLLILFGVGVVHAVLFRACNQNLIVLWPLLWTVGSAPRSLAFGTATFGWEEAFVYAILLVMTVIGLVLIARK